MPQEGDAATTLSFLFFYVRRLVNRTQPTRKYCQNGGLVMASRGRPRKAVGLHKQDGTYRHHRHDGMGVDAAGKPQRPRGMSKHRRWLWDLMLDHLPAECFGKVDEAALLMACEFWEQFQVAKDTGNLTDMAKAARQLQAILSQFGWTPGDRAKLKTPSARPDDDESRFFGVTG